MEGHSRIIAALTRGLAISGARFAGAALNFVLFGYLSKTLGLTATGIYATALATTTILGQFARLGSDNYLLKFGSAHLASNPAKFSRDLGSCLKLIAISATAVTLTSLAFSEGINLVIFGNSLDRGAVIGFMLSIPFICAYYLGYIFLQSKQKNAQGMVLLSCAPPLTTLAALHALGTLGTEPILAASLAHLAGTATCALFALTMMRRSYISVSFIQVKATAIASLPFAIGALLQQGNIFAETIMVSALASASDAGVYAVSLRLSNLVYFVFMSVNMIVASQVSTHLAHNNLATLKSILRNYNLAMIGLAIPILMVLLLFSGEILSIFNISGSHEVAALRIMAVGQALFCLAGSAASLLLMSGNHSAYKRIMIATISIQLLAGFILIKSYGLLGGALSFLLASAVQNILLVHQGYRKTGLSPSIIVDLIKRS